MINLSLNEVETIAAKAARGAGFSWGLAEEIGRAARAMAMKNDAWGEALLALGRAANSFEAPSGERIAHWRLGEPDLVTAVSLCPVRTAALLLDDGSQIDREPLRLANVGLPIWLDVMMQRSGNWVADVDDPFAARSDVTIRHAAHAKRAPAARRAAVAPEILDALDALAARTYVPESERSRARGAGGGSVDDE